MGNEQSAETPRGYRKLSKPPLCSQESAAGLPYNATAVTPHREHFSNSYLVGSLPPAPNKASSTRRVAPGLGIAVPVGDGPSPMSSPTCRDFRRDPRPRAQSIQSEQSPRLSSFVNSSRTNSLAAPDSGYRSLTRAESMPVAAQRGSAGLNTRAAEAKKLLDAKQKLPSEPIISKSKIYSETSQNVTDDTNNANPSAGSSISRTNSDVSLYMPVRRRSIIQKPGVATRAHHSSPPIPTKSTFRKSLPSTPSQTRHNSIESGIARRMSMPSTIPPHVQSLERAATPVEADYKQLGGMKFGSLRIMNGAPVTSPAPEDDPKQRGMSESALVVNRADYFDEHASNPLNLMGAGFTMAEAGEPMTAGQPVTHVPGDVAEHSSGASKSRTSDGGMSYNGNAVSFPVAEVLDVREDLNAKTTPGKINLELENKMLKGLTRSDSGFIPSPSSDVQQTASRVDSGYSSNVSLRSLPSLRSGVTEKSIMASERLDIDVTGMYSPSDSNSTRTSSLAPSQSHNRLPIHLEVPSLTDDDTTSTCPTSPASPAARPFSPFGYRSRMRLSSLTSNKSSEPRVPKAASIPVAATNPAADEQQPAPSLNVGRSGSKIYRFLNSSRKKGSLKERYVHAVERDVPVSPSGQPSRLAVDTQPKPQRSGLRKEASKDTLQTILSVESQDMGNGARREKEDKRNSKQTTPKKMSWRQSWRQSIIQMFGSRSTDAGPTLKQESKPLQNRPATAMELITPSSQSTRSPRTTSSLATRPMPKKAASTAGSLPSPTRGNANRSSVQERRDKPELAHLRTNVSAPNLAGGHRSPLSPSARFDMEQALRTKTSPPVSMQTRSAKPARGKSQGHSRSMTPSFPVNAAKPNAGRRLSLPQDLGRTRVHTRQVSRGSESRNSSRGMVMVPTPVMNSQQAYTVQQPGVLSYSSTGTQQMGPAVSQPRHHHRRASAPVQPRQSANVPRSRSNSTLLQQQQQLYQQQQQQQQQFQQQHRSHSSLQAWTPIDMYSLNHQLQQNYMMQNQALVYGTPQMAQQYPNIYLTGPIPAQVTHRRESSQSLMNAQDAPFRVLHSYNSPAYRGAPIWSQ
ncbi:hypothetical protein F66182_6757 [Fusarium sp. NRRL 66182]|nr:hypothetical protein F66182_6757 [Fusarium sp. NRRL 66182]